MTAVATAPEGTRNGTLNTAAFNLGQLVSGSGLDEDVVIQELLTAATMAGLSEGEALATIRSGPTSAKAKPRITTPTDQGDEDHTDDDLIDLRHLRISGGQLTHPPTVLTLTDGTSLLYVGRSNVFSGAPESGKTWIALQAATEVLRAGGRVTFIDLEDSAPGILERLTALGVTDEELDRLQYSTTSSVCQNVVCARRPRLRHACTSGPCRRLTRPTGGSLRVRPRPTKPPNT